MKTTWMQKFVSLSAVRLAVGILLLLAGGSRGAAQGNGLTITTHGWQQSLLGDDYVTWIDTMSNSIQSQMGTFTWTSTTFHWEADASNMLSPGVALGNAYTLGSGFAADNYFTGLDLSQYDKIHFIAHSAGSGFAAALSNALRSVYDYQGIIQITFLDAYTPYGLGGDTLDARTFLTKAYTGANIIEHYYNTGDAPFTEWPVTGANNYDVTWKSGHPTDNRYDFYTVDGHSWPWQYYQHTVSDVTYDPGAGFALSLERSSFATMGVSVNALTKSLSQNNS